MKPVKSTIHVSMIPLQSMPNWTQKNTDKTETRITSSERERDTAAKLRTIAPHTYDNHFHIHDEFVPIQPATGNFLSTYYDPPGYDLVDVLQRQRSIRETVFTILQLFQSILASLLVAERAELTYFNLSSDHILFRCPHTIHEPQLHGAYLVDTADIARDPAHHLPQLLQDIHIFSHIPLELHLLYHMERHNLTTIQPLMAVEFCEGYVRNMPVLSLLQPPARTTFATNVAHAVYPLINKTRTQLLDFIAASAPSWSTFEVSVMFIHIFGCIHKLHPATQSSAVGKILTLLLANIHPDYTKRVSIAVLSAAVDKIVSEETGKFMRHMTITSVSMADLQREWFN